MSTTHPVQIPWASLAVLVTLVSGTLLAPQAFDLLRPVEKERAQARVGAELEIDARLWEDPFTAVRRHETERLQRCDKVKPSEPASAECGGPAFDARRSAAGLLTRLDADRDGDYDEALVIAVMVPGNPFVGAEESRRRTRYALLAGLQAESYLPDNAEHIGVMNVDVSAFRRAGGDDDAAMRRAGGHDAKDDLLLPYEVFTDRRDKMNPIVKLKPIVKPVHQPDAAADAPPERARPFRRAVAVLWIDESALPSPKLDGLAFVLQATLGKPTASAHVALIGPSTSDGLRSALERLHELATVPRALADGPRGAVLDGLRILARARVFNSAATLGDTGLGIAPWPDVQSYLRDRLTKVLALSEPPSVQFQRTIATDDVTVKALADELELRLPPGRGQRIVTITESDSIYARALERQVMKATAAPPQPQDRMYFFRGVDGMTVREASDRPAGTKSADAPAAIEWPESRDQLDYLRRMAAELRRSETIAVERDGRQVAAQPIGAIGIFAHDVHDKLLILQALHESFPDTVFFTTDMDARYLHPRTLPFTRNLIVASSLPLQFEPQRSDPNRRPLQAGTPPFRDVYQASAYVAARLAACVRCDRVFEQAFSAREQPSVYEIGREGAVAVAGLDLAQRRAHEPTAAYSVVLLFGSILVFAGLFAWPRTPAVRAARGYAASATPAQAATCAGLGASSAFIALYCALLAVLTGSALEALAPASLGLRGIVVWALLAAAAALVVTPGAWAAAHTPWLRQRRWARGAAAVVAFALLLYAGYAAMSPPQPYAGEPLAWVQGISGWPSHFINLLALLSGLVALDMLWQRTRRALDHDNDWLALPADPRADALAEPCAGKGWRCIVARLRAGSLLGWRNGHTAAVEFALLWRQYRVRGSTKARLLRVSCLYVLVAAVVAALFCALSDDGWPAVPVRGAEHRQLIAAGLFAALLVLPLVVVAVADATLLVLRLMALLTEGRTRYPQPTVARFAAELGPVHAALWSQPIDAEPSRRKDAAPPASAHSLLDDWIDIQVIARRTRAVAPLVVAPLLMLALLVVARSRLFDNWALTWPMAASAALYVLLLGCLAVLLKLAAERARAQALQRMNADLLWLHGADAESAKLVEPMKRLIAAVEANRTGAFAPPFDQWFFKGLLVPLGGAGAAQLLERLLMAR